MKIDKELLKGSTATLLLKLLALRNMYGYELIKELEKRSDHVFSLKEGTLYPILHGLEAGGWVEAYWEEHEGRKRKYYEITSNGKQRLQEKQEEWNVFQRAVVRVLGEENR